MSPRNILEIWQFFDNHCSLMLLYDTALAARSVCHCLKLGCQIYGVGAVIVPPIPTTVITNQSLDCF